MRLGACLVAMACVCVPLQLRASVAEIDELTLCVECHDRLAEELAAPNPHPPAQEGDCSSCHNPHVSRYAKLLRARESRLCEGCHPLLAEDRQKQSVHLPIAEGRCTSCHQPHGSANRNLLVAPNGRELCGTCHQTVANWNNRKERHAPFAEGDCFSCHEAHASENEGLLSRPRGEICSACHSEARSLAESHGGYPVRGADCSSCHDPHASDRQALLRTFVHTIIEGGSCRECHPPADTGRPISTPRDVVQLCGGCHPEELADWQVSGVRHVPESEGGCVACHNPHAADEFGLVRSATCHPCHDRGGLPSDQPGRHVNHGKDLGCTECHEPHGNDRPLYLVEEVIGLCLGCHSTTHQFSHPMGDEATDPQDGRPIDCLTCHGIHSAAHDKLLLRSAERDLCVSCHTDIVRGRR